MSNVAREKQPENLDEEERIRWVVGYRGVYAVTDTGRVFSYHRREVFEMSPTVNHDGYHVVTLCLDGDRKKRFVHRLMLKAFVRLPDEEEVTRHLDGNPVNNTLDNICWGTHEDNMGDVVSHGTQRGAKNGNAKFTEDDVLQIRKRFDRVDSLTYTAVANEYGADVEAIRKIVRGKTWKHVGGPISDEIKYSTGDSHPDSKLTEFSVKFMRIQFSKGGVSTKELAGKYGVASGTIRKVLRGETWKSAGGPLRGVDY